MNITQIGLTMILIPVSAMVCFVIGMLFYLISIETANAYIDGNVAMMIVMIFVWSFIIGVALVLIGSR